MRIFGALFLVILLAVAIMLFLQSRDAEESFRAVTSMADELREPGVSARSLDWTTAERVVSVLEALVREPTAVADHVEDLRTIAATAASWAQSAPTPSVELRVAVTIRGAADELRSYATRPSSLTLARARGLVQEARLALQGDAPPFSATDAVRDRLRNLQRSHQEQLQRLEEELGN